MRNILILIFVFSIMVSCNGQYTDTLKNNNMNKLSYSSSPYLQQHSDNPVHWQEWGDEALQMAKDNNKPLIISIGYAACHWCHVMEHESFSDEEVAEFMNENFVCIKIDREERPDIDQIYMDAVQLISGRGGWPLNAFALSDGRPFFAGTYFNKQQWMDVLMQISDMYKNDNQKVVGYANELTNGINKNPLDIVKSTSIHDFKNSDYTLLLDQWLNQVDTKNGGFSLAPKFPMPATWEFLLQYNYFTSNTEALEAVELTLDEMSKGGIYDQIGGGFARYSVDEYWKVPHFEKMLYDNSQLVSLYSHAYQVTKSSRYKEIIQETLEFIDREMTDENGGFYSSLNADSEGVEGKYYVWSYDELINIVDHKHLKLILDYYQITEKGNWEHGINILLPVTSKEVFAIENNIELAWFETILNHTNDQLLVYREKREKPSTDNKILTAWNALMIMGYLDAYKAIGDDMYLQKAISNAQFLENNMLADDGILYRNYMNEKASITGFHDDYTLFAQACAELYTVTFDNHWLELSKNLTDYCINHFYDSQTGMFYYTSNQSESLIARKYELTDNVIPSSNSIMANVLFKLSHYYDDKAYNEIVVGMMNNELDNIKTSGIWHANWAILLGLITNEPTEVAIMGVEYGRLTKLLQKNYLPGSLFLGGMDENLPLLENKKIDGSTIIYVCRNKTCNLPVDDVSKALEQINSGNIRHQ